MFPYRLLIVTRVAFICVTVLLVVSCTADSVSTTTTADANDSTTIAATTTASTATELPGCRQGAPRVGFDLEYARLFDAYRHSQTELLVELMGDGPVYDPWLDPDNEGRFPDLESWVVAGNEVTDRFYDSGYGFGEPFQVFTTRRNEILERSGIEDLSVTLDLWVNQDCELRVVVHSPIASPDPCVLDDVFTEQDVEVCAGPFPPTAYHQAVWTGSEVFAFGGHSGALDWNVKPSGFLFDPASGEVTDFQEPPVDDGWAVYDVLWVDDRALVVGQSLYVDETTDYRPSIIAFDPAAGTWDHVTTFPDERTVVGAAVVMDDALIFAGGDQNGPSDQVWTYSLETGQWRHLGDAPIPSVEEARGVWTGSEAVFVGGYSEDRFVHHAYDPEADEWRELSDPGVGWIEYHDLYWTGEKVIVAPMHIYTEELGVHNSLTLLMYDPTTDTWSESSENPAQPPIRGAVTWSGSELLFLGGFSSTGHPTSEGSAYDPVTDTWRLLSDSPLSARSGHTGTWTGEVWVIIGGSEHGGSPGGASLSDGAIYNPSADTWQHLGD